MHFAALEINLRHFETPLENKHRGVKHVSIDFAGVHTATREIIGWYRVCGVFQFYDSGHDGTGGSRCNSICKKLLLLVFLVSTWQTKKLINHLSPTVCVQRSCFHGLHMDTGT
jgi:hypothetical protein